MKYLAIVSSEQELFSKFLQVLMPYLTKEGLKVHVGEEKWPEAPSTAEQNILLMKTSTSLGESYNYPQVAIAADEDELSTLKTSFTVGSFLVQDQFVLSAENINTLKEIMTSDALTRLPQLNCGHCGFDSCAMMLEAIIQGKRTLDDCEPMRPQKWLVSLQVNGKEVPLVHFVQDMLRESLIGAVKTLKGVELPVKELTFQVKRGDVDEG